MKHIVIIWAGAAGLMTTATILESSQSRDYHIHLFEKNTSPWKKVIISGGGRCNVTTAIEDKKILSTKYVRGWEFIRKAMGKFSPRKCREWFEAHGVPLKIQEDMRVFPISDDGNDIVGVFQDIFAKYRDNISIHYGEWITDVSVIPEHVGIQSSSIDPGTSPGWQKQSMYQLATPKWTYTSDILVITTGWNAYSHTGSTGDGYAFARALGHSVTTLWPSLSSFLTGETWLHALSGVAFSDATLLTDDVALSWPLLLTHFGISGPLAFMISSHLAWEDIGAWHERVVYLRPLSTLSENDWDEYLKSTFIAHPKKVITSILGDKLPRRFVDVFVGEYFTHISDTFASSISRKDRERIAELLGRGIPLTLLERRPGDEFVTAGGISTDELDPLTMESRIRQHLYFAGEVLNVDGYTGGFSLQICWASGYVAGRDIAEQLSD